MKESRKERRERIQREREEDAKIKEERIDALKLHASLIEPPRFIIATQFYPFRKFYDRRLENLGGFYKVNEDVLEQWIYLNAENIVRVDGAFILQKEQKSRKKIEYAFFQNAAILINKDALDDFEAILATDNGFFAYRYKDRVIGFPRDGTNREPIANQDPIFLSVKKIC